MPQPVDFPWPEGCRGAVSLTYDDGLACHYEHVAPVLEAAGLRGTFYVPVRHSTLTENTTAWKDVAARGHELGNHTLFHPCMAEKPDDHPWLDRDAYNLAGYNALRWTDEMTVANYILGQVDGRTERTFGNTCCDGEIGLGDTRQSLEPLVEKLFVAARGTYRAAAVDPWKANLNNLGHYGADRKTFEIVKSDIDKAVADGGWIIYMIHGVGDGTHKSFMDTAEHAKMVDWLGQQADRIWTAPMVDVARHVREAGRRA